MSSPLCFDPLYSEYWDLFTVSMFPGLLRRFQVVKGRRSETRWKTRWRRRQTVQGKTSSTRTGLPGGRGFGRIGGPNSPRTSEIYWWKQPFCDKSKFETVKYLLLWLTISWLYHTSFKTVINHSLDSDLGFRRLVFWSGSRCEVPCLPLVWGVTSKLS